MKTFIFILCKAPRIINLNTALHCIFLFRFSGVSAYIDFNVVLFSAAVRFIMVKYAKELVIEGK